jgi:hypothetical protein
LASRLHHAHFGAEQLHAKNVQRLAPDIFLAHENLTGKTKAGSHRGRRHPVLPRAGFSDNALLAHAPGE